MHVMHVMVMVVVMVMMMMVHWLGHGSRGGRRFLRHCVSGEAERENGRGRKGLDHGRTFCGLRNPNGSQRVIGVAA